MPTKEDTLHARFLALKQESIVVDYREKFEEYSAPLDNLDDDTLEGKFIDGLIEDIKVEMKISKPVVLNLKMEMVQKIEDKLLHSEAKRTGASLSSKVVGQNNNTSSKPTVCGAGTNACMISVNLSRL